MIKTFFRSGVPFIWWNAGALALSLVAVLGLLALIATKGLAHFWPATVYQFLYQEREGDTVKTVRIIGEAHAEERVGAQRLIGAGEYLPDGVGETVTRRLYKWGNRDLYGFDFGWIITPRVSRRETPEDLVVLERFEWGNAYGYLRQVKQAGDIVGEGGGAWDALQPLLARSLALHAQIAEIEKQAIGRINYRMERLRLRQRGLQLDGKTPQSDPLAYQALADERAQLDRAYGELQSELTVLYRQVRRDAVVLEVQTGAEKEIGMDKIVYAYRPNAMTVIDKLGHYFHKMGEFVFDDPREANTEGGVFPAIFGTVMMVMIMAVIVTPFGVVAAVYLREYAKQNVLTRTIRVAVNNLAGVPSIVYGVFGLGFFVYFLGGNIDALFFPEAQPAPTFGTPGILWASLTLAILTLPVVIVSTEEGLSRIPMALREGSLALGATKFETVWKVILPMSSPAMMTGLILAVARAAGEVAPLMLVGVVKLAPTLAVDTNFPFLHLERKFMHLGFHIYDVGFQSPNVEAARPLVYATALLLVLVIIVLNLTSVTIRNRLREKYRALDH